LAVPPGYASPIFPPAGIAVAAMLIGGPATLPWTFLESLSLNSWIGYSAAHSIDVARVAAAIAIALASTLQAAVGGIALRRVVGYPAPLDNGRHLARFLSSSPVFCLASATLSIGALALLGVVRLPDLLLAGVAARAPSSRSVRLPERQALVRVNDGPAGVERGPDVALS
jgi:hypothetical protein